MQGRTDIQLNDTGIAQALDVKKKLKNTKIDICFSSPLSRAFSTAKIITDLDIILDERLIERDAGNLETKKSV